MSVKGWPVDRRGFLRAAGAAAAAYALPLSPGRAAAPASAGTGRKFVFILMRGGLDGLHLLPPVGDAAYAGARRGIAVAPVGEAGGALALDGFFGLHPTMPRLREAFAAGEAAFVHAVAPPYRLRSHFSAQEILENGTTARGAHNGWLARSLGVREQMAGVVPLEALSLGGTLLPLSLQGARHAAAWSPGDPNMNARTKDALKAVFRTDPIFAGAADFIGTLDQLAPLVPHQPQGDLPHEWPKVTEAAARLMAAPTGPDAVAIDLFGWDSHAYQGGADGNLGLLTGHLDEALARFKTELGPLWPRTVIVAMTEFGRTVEVNGTGGTDHGVGGAAILLGGAVKGGRVIADWPGLKPEERFEGRDLRATADTRAVLKGLLRDHWGLDRAQLAQTVFPGSADVAPMEGLVRL